MEDTPKHGDIRTANGPFDGPDQVYLNGLSEDGVLISSPGWYEIGRLCV